MKHGGFWGFLGVFGGKVKKGKTPTPKNPQKPPLMTKDL